MSVHVSFVPISAAELRIWQGREDRRSEVPPAVIPFPYMYFVALNRIVTECQITSRCSFCRRWANDRLRVNVSNLFGHQSHRIGLLAFIKVSEAPATKSGAREKNLYRVTTRL